MKVKMEFECDADPQDVAMLIRIALREHNSTRGHPECYGARRYVDQRYRAHNMDFETGQRGFSEDWLMRKEKDVERRAFLAEELANSVEVVD